jgi:hypothetical protein
LGDSESHEITFVYSEGSPTVPYTTPRGQSYGEEYFGNFAAALFTLFQALMGDSWSEAIARSKRMAAARVGPPLSSRSVVGAARGQFPLCSGVRGQPALLG